MSRSYAVLLATLVGLAGLVGIVAVLQADRDERAVPTTVDPPDQPSLADDLPAELGPDPVDEIDPDCTLSQRLDLDVESDEVACLESQLIAAGVLAGVAPDDVFDEATEAAVRSFQRRNDLVVDGVVGPETANRLGSWVGPDVLPPDPGTCPTTGRAAVIDRYNQRNWLCDDGVIESVMPMTSAVSQPGPGTYEVYAKDLNASSTLSGDYSTMTHFVAFTHGKYQGARIAFHSIPKYRNGDYVQPLDSVGTAELFGESSGCIRVLPDDAERIWNWLDIGDEVVVVT